MTSFGINITVMGFEAVLKELERAEQQIIDALSAALYQKGNLILADAVPITPTDQGDLRKSAYVAPPQMIGGEPVVDLGFGTDHAVFAHELPDDSNFTSPGTMSKFLQRPLEEHQRGYAQEIARLQKDNMRRGLGLRAVNKEFPTRPKESK